MTAIGDLLHERIRREGPLSFREVMDQALYHPELGYYTRLRGFGAEGDFVTSPERHPAFGWLLGRQAADVWRGLGEPSPFRILEIGGGSGALAVPLVACLRREIGAPISYAIDERSPSLRTLQRARVAGDTAFTWDIPQTADFILANEVADALPVHRGVMQQGSLHELLVGLEGDELTWLIDPHPSAPLNAYFEALHWRPAEGEVVDVCLDLGDWVKGLAARMAERSVGLVLDYTASPPRDSLLTYYRHTMGSDPLVRLGEQDISAHVDLRTLVRLAIAEGLRAGATAQRGLLFNLGFQQVVEALPSPTNRAALDGLVDAHGLGGQIAAVFLLRGLPEYRPVGAVGGVDWPPLAETDVPSLPPDATEQDFLSQWREAFPGEADQQGQAG